MSTRENIRLIARTPLGLFKVNVQIWKMFLGSLKFEYVLGMPDIP